MSLERRVKLVRSGGAQVLSIPPEFELASEDVILRKQGDQLVIEPWRSKSLLAWLATLEPLEEDFPRVDD